MIDESSSLLLYIEDIIENIPELGPVFSYT